jgi:hypothetical protein
LLNIRYAAIECAHGTGRPAPLTAFVSLVWPLTMHATISSARAFRRTSPKSVRFIASSICPMMPHRYDIGTRMESNQRRFDKEKSHKVRHGGDKPTPALP